MKKTILFAPIIAIAVVSTLFSCVDSDKDLYDSSFQMPNPMGDGFAAPEGFGWDMITNIRSTVEANDKFNGNFYYVVELFDANPIISADARLLDKGVAKENEPYTSEISINKSLKTIYIKETTPTGLFTVRAAEITNGIIHCSFKTPATSLRSHATSRGFVTIEDPDANDTSLFPAECPANVTEKFKNEQSSVENASYRITSEIRKISLGQKKNIKLYVTEDITLSEQIYLTSGSCLYILPGKKVSMPQSANNGQSNSMITIGKGATLTVDNNLQLDSNFRLYNLGNMNAKNLNCTNSSVFYNAGTTNIEKKLSGENSGSTLINAGILKAEDIDIQGNSHVINRDLGSVEVTDETVLNCTGGSWENDGEWITEDMSISAWNEFSYNRCKLIVKDEFDINAGWLIVDGGGYVQCKELYMDNARVDLGAKSLFHVTEEAEYGYQTNDKGFKGTGAEKALLVIKKAVAKNIKNNDIIHYSGNLQIVCSDHPDALVDAWNTRWTMTNGAEWGEEGKNTITLPETECNNGYNGGTPTPPTEPSFPIELEDNHEYTYLFEDQWPLYGDYDMNDIVMTIRQRKLKTNKQKKVVEFSLSIDLEATGAMKSLGAAIMLDDVSANSITNSVEFADNNLQKTFNLNNRNIENGQDNAVIPLFDNAHLALGRQKPEAINTISGYSGNTKAKNISFTIKFSNPTLSAEAFNINKLNIFIIVGGNRDKRNEIHVVGYQPTNLANTDQFGGNNDNSSLSNKRYYISKDNLAWGIAVPTNFKWPLEYVNIKNAYPQFVNWVTSGGTENKNWWNDFNVSNVFQTNKN